MNKSDFLAALDEALRQLPPENRRATLDYYSEMIDDRIEDGLPEADAFVEDFIPSFFLSLDEQNQ